MEVEFGPCRAVTEGPAGQSMWRGGSGRCPWCWRRRPGALRGAARPGRAGDRGRGAAGRGEAVAERSTAVSALPQSVCKHWSALLAGLALAFPGSKNIPTEGEEKEILTTTWATRALKKVLDADPGTNREMGTRTNPTGMSTSSFCFLFHVVCRQRSSTCKSALVLSLLQSTEHLPIVLQNRPFLSLHFN